MLNFGPIANAAPAPGLVLRLGGEKDKYLRITHVFGTCIYAMWVGEPESARYARRPIAISLIELQKLAQETDAKWGRLSLPPSLSSPPKEDSDRARKLEAAWELIRPVIDAFEREGNLRRQLFSALIRERADATSSSFITVNRLILRYYYFGRLRQALLALPPGTKPGNGSYVTRDDEDAELKPKRRGRQSILASELGHNDFIVSETDIDDMVSCLRACLRNGPTSISAAHEYYLAGAFRRRYPDVHSSYISGKFPEPVTLRQYRYYVTNHARLSDELSSNLRLYARNPGHLGSVMANGPGEVYEIDSTGGRIHLVATRGEDQQPIVVGRPTIYLIIDRWSRFIVSAYIGLRPPSYEEVRHALLVAFTSRERRFAALGVDIDDERWPVGRMPAVLCPDRGSEFMSESMEQSVVNDLKIELTPLPPYCPDGKAIVERAIREMKRRMAASGMKGTYAERPMDPRTKRATRKAEAVPRDYTFRCADRSFGQIDAVFCVGSCVFVVEAKCILEPTDSTSIGTHRSAIEHAVEQAKTRVKLIDAHREEFITDMKQFGWCLSPEFRIYPLVAVSTIAHVGVSWDGVPVVDEFVVGRFFAGGYDDAGLDTNDFSVTQRIHRPFYANAVEAEATAARYFERPPQLQQYADALQPREVPMYSVSEDDWSGLMFDFEQG